MRRGYAVSLVLITCQDMRHPSSGINGRLLIYRNYGITSTASQNLQTVPYIPTKDSSTMVFNNEDEVVHCPIVVNSTKRKATSKVIPCENTLKPRLTKKKD